MRIAQVSPLIESVPPKGYGGIERVVHNLTEKLVAQGHEVTLFASGDSQTSADLVAVVPQSLRQSEIQRDPYICHTLQLAEVQRLADKFDIVHFHTDIIHYPSWRLMSTPQITTLHGRLDLPDLAPIYNEFDDMAVVSISDAQRKPLPQARWVSTVYNGIPAENFTFQPKAGDYFAFLGRMSPEKGPEQAIEIAKRTQTPLRMAAKIDAVDKEYFAEKIQPLLADPLLEFIGEVNEQEKDVFLGGAKALLFPIDWPEPFGLVMTESMACGTPVVAFRCGSVPEVMREGVSGYVVETVDEAVEAVAKLPEIDRRKCRQYFERNFSVGPMTEGYLEVYQQLVNEQEVGRSFPRWHRPPVAASSSMRKPSQAHAAQDGHHAEPLRVGDFLHNGQAAPMGRPIH